MNKNVSITIANRTDSHRLEWFVSATLGDRADRLKLFGGCIIQQTMSNPAADKKTTAMKALEQAMDEDWSEMSAVVGTMEVDGKKLEGVGVTGIEVTPGVDSEGGES